jgi:DNA primase
MSVTDEIKARLDIVSYISQVVPLKKAGSTYKACCPFHNESTPSFVVDPNKQTWRCYGACADGGDIFSFAQRYYGWEFRQALEELGKSAGVEVTPLSSQQRDENKRLDHLRGLMRSASDYYHQQLTQPTHEQARDVATYAEKRGLSAETIALFQIGFAPQGWSNILDYLTGMGYSQEDLIAVGLVVKNEQGRVYDRFRNRLIIPIRDERGRVVAFGGRVLDPNDNPKYLNSPQTILFDKSRTLFGLDTAKRAIREQETVVIVEGYMDAIQAQQAGFYNVVAQMGTAMTEMQLGLIAPRYARRVILALDADAAGQSATRRSLEVARQALEADYAGRMSVDMRILQIPDAKDPDDLIRESPETWQKMIDQALPVADFVIQMELNNLPPNPSIQEREAMARSVLPILMASENNLYQQDNLQKLSSALRIQELTLLQWAQEQQTKQPPKPPAPAKPVNKPISKQSPPAPTFDDAPYVLRDDSYYADNEPDYHPVDADDLHQMDGQQLDAHPANDMTLQPVVMPTPRVTPMFQQHEPDNLKEGRCLRLLFLNPTAYYQINHHLHETAGDDYQLSESILGNFGVGDFTRPVYRALMQMFLYGLYQAESEVLEFLRTTLDPAMREDLERLLQEENHTINERLKKQFGADAEMVWKQYERRGAMVAKPEHEIIICALEMRHARIKRETIELQFASKNGDATADNIIQPTMPIYTRALHRLDSAIEAYRRQFA